LLKQHYSRYTPDTVASICGCSADEFQRAAAVICSTGHALGRGTILYALGWTQHSHSVQLIHTAAMLQLLLGNIGVPGGGVNAQRGHSNIQGATDLGAWNKMPGYLDVPRADQLSLDDYLKSISPKPLQPGSLNYWQNADKFTISLLKSYYGDKATADNEFGYQYLPKLAPGDDHSWGFIFDRMANGKLQGLISFGMNPVANGPNSAKMIAALGKLKWLIVADCFETETASFWKAQQSAGQYYPATPPASSIETEVFLLPAGCFAEKEGAFVNSSRWLQWKTAALDPPGQARNDQAIIARLFLKIRELYRAEGGTAPEPLRAIDWSYSNPSSPSLVEVAQEINGRDDTTGIQLDSFSQLKADGSTRCGNWLYCGSFSSAGNQMARRGQDDPSGLGFYHGWSWNWPLNRRILYNRASANEQGQPWDVSRVGIQWNGRTWTGDVPDYPRDAPPDSLGPFIMLPEGVARLFAANLVEGPFPEHYEPAESPVANLLHPNVNSNPLRIEFTGEFDRLGSAQEYPYVAITYRLTEHFHFWTKHVAANSELQPHFFVEVPHALASQLGIANRDLVEVVSARGFVRGQALVTRRIRPLTINGTTVFQIGLPIHWGFLGRVTGPLVNNLSPSVMDPNSGTPEYKGFLVNLKKV
jgi:formate dehydrogenase major subunit